MKPARKPDSKRVAFWLGLLLLLIGIILLLRIASEYQKSVWVQNQDRITLALYTNPVVLISFSKGEEVHSIMTMPEDVLTNVPFGYGEYRLGATWKLGLLEKRPELFAESTADLTGVRVDGWFARGEPIALAIETDAELINSLKEHFSLVPLARTNYSTNLSKLDTLLIGFLFKGLKPGNTLTYLAHRNEYLFQSDKLPNQVPVQKVNKVAFEEYMEQKFENSRARTEALTIRIINTTGVTGVGSNFANYLNHYGGKVIAITDTATRVPNCEVVVRVAHENSQIVNFLVHEFQCLKTLSEKTLEADMEVLVGQSFAERWKINN